MRILPGLCAERGVDPVIANGENAAGGGPVTFNSVLVDVDETSGRARGIMRIDRETTAA